MAYPAERLATYDDLFDLPEHQIGQIIYGQLIALPRPAPKHILACANMSNELHSPFQKGHGGPGGWWILCEPELHLNGHILVPDLAAWRKDRMPTMPETAYFDIEPDWVCEILSPSTARIDRADKMPIYAQAQIAYLWLLDPDRQILETFQLQNGHWLLLKTYQQDNKVSAPPFEAIGFDLAGIWI